MWTEELARTLGIWLVMVGAGVVLKGDGHIGLNLISDRLQVFRRILTHIIVLTFSILVFQPAMAHVGVSLGRLSMAMRVPLMVLYAAMPVGILNLMLWSAFGLTDEIVRLVVKGGEGTPIQ
jgi:TRAP-type C4-dicarboxylate transport system permease small subunit